MGVCIFSTWEEAQQVHLLNRDLEPDLDLVGKAIEAAPRSLLTQAEYVEDVYSCA